MAPRTSIGSSPMSEGLMAAHNLRVVLDTNVVVSSFWGGNPKRVLDRWKTGHLTLLISLPILEEYLAVLARLGFTEVQLKEEGLLFLQSPTTSLIHPTRNFQEIPADPSDNKFLDCAVEGKAVAIVSGDKHLLNLKAFQDIPILTPADFLKQHA